VEEEKKTNVKEKTKRFDADLKKNHVYYFCNKHKFTFVINEINVNLCLSILRLTYHRHKKPKITNVKSLFYISEN